MKRLFAAAALAAMLAGCGGGGGGHVTIPSTNAGSGSPGSTVPVSTSSNATATVIAKASLAATAIPQLYDRKVAAAKRSSAARLKQSGTSITNVEVDGTLYQGSASAVPVTNTQTVAVTNGTITVSETFSNVVPANNDWVMFEFYAVAADGSKTAIGSLGTLVNVGASTTTTNLGTASTQVLQVAGALMDIGAISTYDIEQNSGLAATLATDIAGTGLTANSQTGLFDATTLLTLVEQLATAFERDITITVANATEFSVVYDYTQADENDLAYNAASFASIYGLNVTLDTQPAPVNNGTGVYSGGTIIGAPLSAGYTTLPLHAPSSGYTTAQPEAVASQIFAGQNSVTLKNVYGGHLIIGAHNGVNAANASPSPTGGSVPAGVTTAIAGEAPGASTQTLTLANTIKTLQVSDPQAIAFGQEPGSIGNNLYFSNVSFGFAVLAGSTAAGTIPEFVAGCDGLCSTYGLIDNGQFTLNSQDVQETAPVSGVSTISYDSWNTFNIPTSQIEICGLTSCTPVTSGSTANVSAAFADNGTNDAVYGWTASAGSSIANGTAYQVTFPIPANNTAPVTVTLMGTVPSAFGTPAVDLLGSVYVPGRALLFLNDAVPSGTSTTVTLTDISGNTYSSAEPVAGFSQFFFTNATAFALKSFSITFTIPASSAINTTNAPATGQLWIDQFYAEGTNSNLPGAY